MLLYDNEFELISYCLNTTLNHPLRSEKPDLLETRQTLLIISKRNMESDTFVQISENVFIRLILEEFELNFLNFPLWYRVEVSFFITG